MLQSQRIFKQIELRLAEHVCLLGLQFILDSSEDRKPLGALCIERTRRALLAFLQHRDAKNVSPEGGWETITENHKAVKLINRVNDTQCVVPCNCGHLGIMTRPRIGVYLWSICPPARPPKKKENVSLYLSNSATWVLQNGAPDEAR